MGQYILRQDNFTRASATEGTTNKVMSDHFGPNGKWLGWALTAMPFEAHKVINFTGPPGSVSGIYYSLVFQLRKWEYLVEKYEESIEVSPIHAQYYQLTHKQKEELETRIKAGLQSVSQSVADLELLLHDKRKYEEFLRYLGYRTPKEIPKDCKDHNHTDNEMDEICLLTDNDAKTEKERKKRIDNHSLKAVFVDQVDVHTGDGISIRSIVSRWPTLIIDFMKMEDEDTNADAIAKKLDVSKAEAVVLLTKNKLFLEWKNMFLSNLKDRYKRISQLTRSRNKSVEEYREWLKPIVARHRLITEGLANPGNRAGNVSNWVNAGGHAVSSMNLQVWTWKDFVPPEINKMDTESVGKAVLSKNITPYDKWTKNNLIFGEEHGLINDYPWITHDWVKKNLEAFYDKGRLTRNKFYYSLFLIGLRKTNIKMPTGDELEDGDFDVNTVIVSQNVMFVKLLEMQARQETMNRYIDEMIGVDTKIEGKPEKIKERDRLGGAKNFLDTFNMEFMFFKRGPYERDFNDRLKNFYFGPIAGGRYGRIVNFIQQKMGMGTS